MASKITIEDISRQTGLSRGTVSRALNDRPDISEQTKQRVLEACRKLHYVPSHAARSLATGRNFAVAVLIRDLYAPFTSGFLRGALTAAERSRYVVHVVELGASLETAASHLEMLSSERLDTVLLGAPLDDRLVSQLADLFPSRPVVSCWPTGTLRTDIFMPDYPESGRLAACHLLDRGIREILYVREERDAGADQRWTGCQEACREAGGDARLVEVHSREALDADLASELGGARGVIADSDDLAIAVLLAAYRSGRVSGAEFALVGQGNDPICDRICPPLTSVDYCPDEIGRRAMETAVQRLNKARADTEQTVRVPPRLVIRAAPA